MSTAQEQYQQPSVPSEPDSEQEQEPFSFQVESPSAFIESPQLLWRRVPITAHSSPTTKLESMRSEYRPRSFSCMETESCQMMITTTYDHGNINKMDLLWEDFHELSKTKKYSDDESSDPDQGGTELSSGQNQKSRAFSLPPRRSRRTVTVFKVLKKLFYVRKTGSMHSI